MDILIADDCEDSLLVLYKLLTINGYAVTAVTDGLAALNSARSNPPDLIITDIMMPNMDGFELCRQLKQDNRLATIPIIFYTASFSEEADRQLARALGVTRFVLKPQQPRNLLQVVGEVLALPLPPVQAEAGQTAIPAARIDEMYVRCVGRKLDQKVSELEKERQALKKSEEKFRTIFNSINDAIAIHDAATGAILYTNKTMCTMFGYAEGEFANLEVGVLSADEPAYSTERALQLMHKAIAGEPQVFEWHSKHKSGQLFWTEVNMVVAPIDGHKRVIVVVRDISERKQAEQQRLKLEAQLRQKYKMEAVGVMAGGIAHDFNNKLAIVLGNIEFAQLKTDPYSENSAPLQNAKIATLRARDLVRQILTYSRQGMPSPKPFDLVALLQETLRLLRSTIPTTIDIVSDIAADKVTVNGDATQIQEVLINLCNNAVQAMNDSGQLKIAMDRCAAECVKLPEGYSEKNSNFARITVADNGPGIAPEIRNKIFDLFFTTKGASEGTGMGLAMVQGIVDNHHGFIRLNSTVGQGTIFEVFLPMTVSVPEKAVTTTETAGQLRHGKEKILVVDDEEKLVRIMSRLLSEYGYAVTTMTRSSAALQRVQSKPDEFDLVITDQSMPELSGKELITSLLEIREDLPTILCTGYSNKINEQDARNMGIKAFCMKPLNLDDLIKTVRTVLDEK